MKYYLLLDKITIQWESGEGGLKKKGDRPSGSNGEKNNDLQSQCCDSLDYGLHAGYCSLVDCLIRLIRFFVSSPN